MSHLFVLFKSHVSVLLCLIDKCVRVIPVLSDSHTVKLEVLLPSRLLVPVRHTSTRSVFAWIAIRIRAYLVS